MSPANKTYSASVFNKENFYISLGTCDLQEFQKEKNWKSVSTAFKVNHIYVVLSKKK